MKTTSYIIATCIIFSSCKESKNHSRNNDERVLQVTKQTQDRFKELDHVVKLIRDIEFSNASAETYGEGRYRRSSTTVLNVRMKSASRNGSKLQWLQKLNYVRNTVAPSAPSLNGSTSGNPDYSGEFDFSSSFMAWVTDLYGFDGVWVIGLRHNIGGNEPSLSIVFDTKNEAEEVLSLFRQLETFRERE